MNENESVHQRPVGHVSVRPAHRHDIIVQVRLRPDGLDMLREGMECSFLRLDQVPQHTHTHDGNVYDLYVETPKDLTGIAVPGYDAPHSQSYVPSPLDIACPACGAERGDACWDALMLKVLEPGMFHVPRVEAAAEGI